MTREAATNMGVEMSDYSTRVQDIALTQSHAFVVLKSGKVYSCGSSIGLSARVLGYDGWGDEFKQIDALKELRISRVFPGLASMVYLTNDGQVYISGHVKGSSNISTSPLPRRIALPDGVSIIDVDGGFINQLISSDGRIFNVSETDAGIIATEDEKLAGQKVKSVKKGEEFSLYLMDDGSVFSAGVNEHGQLGHGDKENRSVPTEIEALRGISVSAIEVGLRHSIFIAEDGQVFTCGCGINGVLGYGGNDDKLLPTLIEFPDGPKIVSASTNEAYSLFTSSDRLFACGRQGEKALGMGDDADSTNTYKVHEVIFPPGIAIKKLITIDGDKSLSTTSVHKSIALTDDGRLFGCGDRAVYRCGEVESDFERKHGFGRTQIEYRCRWNEPLVIRNPGLDSAPASCPRLWQEPSSSTFFRITLTPGIASDSTEQSHGAGAPTNAPR